MTSVPIYDAQGNCIHELVIDDDLEYVNGRVSKGKRCYYKGAGVPYRVHMVLRPDPEQYVIRRHSGVFYMGYVASKKCFIGKHGIFQELYQPFFPDHIGACSIKEGTVAINSMTFERSSVDVIDCVEVMPGVSQYYYVMNYLCGRKRYVQDSGDPAKLAELLEYMIKTNWNFLWDKGAITDITFDGRVCDTADLFLSDDLNHKLGTVYSVLHSLGKAQPAMLVDLLRLYGLSYVDESSHINNSIAILSRYGVDVSALMKYDDPNQNYKHVVLEHLIQGKNSAYCSCDMFADHGKQVAKQYHEMISYQLGSV